MSGGTPAHFAQAQRYLQEGKLTDAADCYQHILEHDPHNADALHMLGVVAYQLGQVDAAAALVEQATKERDPFPDAEANLGTILMALGRLPEAESALRRAQEHVPDNPVIAFNLANVFSESGQDEEAERHYLMALELNPDYAEAHSNLGLLLRKSDRLEEAQRCFERAVAAAPDYAEAQYNLANVYRDQGRLGDAERTIRTALTCRPGYAKAWNSLGNILGDMGLPTEAAQAFDEALKWEPENWRFASNKLCALQYLPEITNTTLQEAHTEWYWLHAATDIDPAPPVIQNTAKDRTLKLGFVSPDFGRHPIGFLSAPLFAHLDVSDMETVIFSTRPEALEDEYSVRIANAAGDWRRVRDLDDETLDATIRAAKIDILFDMSGHTAGHRLRLFARKPAPVQMSWIGYVGTTGLPAMDYVVADHRHAPLGTEDHYAEHILRLDDGYICYAPPADAPDTAPLPATKNGYVTFGSLNNPAKLNDAVITAYADILKRVPTSRLLLRFKGLDDPAVNARLTEAFFSHGILQDRLTFEGKASHPVFLDTYNRVDIALDTFPYSGGLTTCEALWMGVPVVTFPGQTFAGRHATSHLTTAGYTDLVCTSAADMADRAIRLTEELDKLAALRKQMRSQVAASPLCDGARFADSFSRTIRAAWHTACAASS